MTPETDNAIRAACRRCTEEIQQAVSDEHCAECGEDITEPRRAAVPGCSTCASCQEEIELKNKQRGM
ncbi:TraR/DksA C4-type zinc finger protein [Citrobacter koseri]|uniref:TraR/DksA C4-type zinc finger protein n=1 Tax=Citrobacter koseri TaxID=545 RepID=UPI0039796A38